MNLAVAQFQPKDGDKKYNLSRIADLTEKARYLGAEVVSFHELSITAYTFLKDLRTSQIADLSENIDDHSSPSIKLLTELAGDHDMTILAGLLERCEDRFYNTYVGVNKNGLVAKFQKLHPFIHPAVSAGNTYCIFDLHGWKCGILICYDNNIIENPRATTLLGADLIFAPHVTGCTPSPMPGRGFVEHSYWENRHSDPQALRAEFNGPKGREWLLRWLPARAYDNGVYYAFSNPIGYDGEQLKNGNSMIIDPYGDIVAEIQSFEDDLCLAEITKDKLRLAGGWRYRSARRPELYKEIIGEQHRPLTQPVWMQIQE